MSFSEDEELFIELAMGRNVVRRVRTPEGAAFYGLPIGSIITADLINKKNAEAAKNGLTPPSGAVTTGKSDPVKAKQQQAKATAPGGSGNKGGSGSKPPAASGARPAGAPGGKKPKTTASGMTITNIQPTIKGPAKFDVGGVQFGVPKGSTLIRPKGKDNIAYVLDPAGNLHAFNNQGEIVIPTHLSSILTQKFADGFAGDDLYEVDDTLGTDTIKDLKKAKAGDVLLGDGAPVFEKLDDGNWVHTALGAVVTDDDVKPLFESGELEYKPGGQGADLRAFDKDSFTKYVAGKEDGATLSLKGNDGKQHTLTKQKKKWIDSESGTPVDESSLYYLKDKLSESPEGETEQPSVEETLDGIAKDIMAKPKKKSAAKKPATADEPITAETYKSAEDSAQKIADKLNADVKAKKAAAKKKAEDTQVGLKKPAEKTSGGKNAETFSDGMKETPKAGEEYTPDQVEANKTAEKKAAPKVKADLPSIQEALDQASKKLSEAKAKKKSESEKKDEPAAEAPEPAAESTDEPADEAPAEDEKKNFKDGDKVTWKTAGGKSKTGKVVGNDLNSQGLWKVAIDKPAKSEPLWVGVKPEKLEHVDPDAAAPEAPEADAHNLAPEAPKSDSTDKMQELKDKLTATQNDLASATEKLVEAKTPKTDDAGGNDEPPATPEAASADEPEPQKVGDEVSATSQLAALPVYSAVKIKKTKANIYDTWVKISDSTWRRETDFMTSHQNLLLAGRTATISSIGQTDEPAAAAKVWQKFDSVEVNDIEAMPVGIVLQPNGDTEGAYIKNVDATGEASKENWEDLVNGGTFTDAEMEEIAENQGLTIDMLPGESDDESDPAAEPQQNVAPAPANGTPLNPVTEWGPGYVVQSGSEVKDKPVGTVLEANYPTGKVDFSKVTYDVDGTDYWESSATGFMATDTEFEQIVDGVKAGTFSVKSVPEAPEADAPEADAPESAAPEAEAPKVGDQVPSAAWAATAPEGAVIGYLKNNGDTTLWTMQPNGMFATPNGYEIEPDKLAKKSTLDAGKLSIVSLPDAVDEPEADPILEAIQSLENEPQAYSPEELEELGGEEEIIAWEEEQIAAEEAAAAEEEEIAAIAESETSELNVPESVDTFEGDPDGEPMTDVSVVNGSQVKAKAHGITKHGEKFLYEKQPNGTWHHEASDFVIANDDEMAAVIESTVGLGTKWGFEQGDGGEVKPQKLRAGEVITDPNAVIGAPVGVTVEYTDLMDDEGEGQGAWDHIAENTWQHTGTKATQTDAQFANIIANDTEDPDTSTVWKTADDPIEELIKSLDDEGPLSALSEAEIEDLKSKVEQGYEVPKVGDKVPAMQWLDDTGAESVIVAVGGHEYEKGKDGLWYPETSDGTWGHTWDEFALWDSFTIKTIVDKPQENSAPGTHTFTKIGDGVDSTPLSTQDIQDVISALENHPHFAIKYGLKSVPDHHITQNVDAFTEAAKKKFPEMKPKQALINLLKGKIGTLEEAPELAEADPAAPTASFRTKKGTFQHNAHQIQHAIDALEASDSVMVKAVLAKAGSPLATLEHKEMIGFIKDKQVQKQTYIDFLKKKLAKLNGKGVDTTPEAVTIDPDELQAEIDAGMADLDAPQKKIFEPGASLTKDDLDALEPGSYVMINDLGSNSYKKKIVKDSDHNFYRTDDGKDVTYLVGVYAGNGYVEFVEGPKEQTPPAQNDQEEEVLADWEQELLSQYTPLTKPNPGETVSWEQLLAMEPGDGINSAVADNSLYIKQENGKWLSPSGAEYPDQAFLSPINSGNVVYASKHPLDGHKPKHGDILSKEQFEKLVVGDQVKHTGLADNIYTKGPDGWHGPAGTLFDDASFNGALNNGSITYHLNGQTAAVAAKTDDEGNGPNTNASGVTPGKWGTKTGKAYMVVKPDGSGIYVTAAGKVSNITPDKVKKNVDAGMKYYKGHVAPEDYPKNEDGLSPAPAKKAAPKGPVDLEPGVYYLGSSEKKNATVYEVTATGVKIFKGGDIYADVEEVPLSKLKTAYFQGKIVDAVGNSVLPKGHNGGAILWNHPTSVAALAGLKKKLDANDISAVLTNQNSNWMAQLGVSINNQALAKKVYAADNTLPNPSFEYFETNSGSPLHAPAKAYLTETIGNILKDADLSEPDQNAASSFFEWTANGEAKFPAAVASLPDYSYGKELKDWVAGAVKNFGDGKILNTTYMGSYQKQQWKAAYKNGDFKAMWILESNAHNAKGKAHPAPLLHPGSPHNEETHAIKWGAAVDGELSAANEVPGNWSSVAVSKWSADEVNNYLIAANMQNPEYLDQAERRQWVTHHKAKNKSVVDNLSLQAQKRKTDGHPAKSEKPVWVDDIKPAKLYDHLFEDTPFPGLSKWSPEPYETSKAWASDNWDNQEFQAVMAEIAAEVGWGHNPDQDVNSHSSQHIEKAVGTYFEKKEAEYQAELLKPVYTKVKEIHGGTHTTIQMTDQFGKLYLFKPVEQTGKEWRNEQEHAANLLGQFWGFNTPGSQMVTIDGEYGQLQEWSDSEGPLMGKDVSTLSTKQLGDLAAEHVLDWMMDNDDTHQENVLLGTNGEIIGIDKGRAFYTYGGWDGLGKNDSDILKAFNKGGQGDFSYNANVVYKRIYQAMADGKLTPEQVQAAYFAAIKAAKKIQKSDDATISQMLKDGTKGRHSWKTPSYMSHHEAHAPKNADELVAAVLQRKATLVSDIEDMWDRIFDRTGLEKPLAPAKALPDDYISGWDEANLTEAVDANKVWGATPLHGSAGIDQGASLLWTEKNTAGQTKYKGKITLGKITSKKILDFLKPISTPASNLNQVNVPTVPNFPNLSTWKSAFSHAGKDITKNSIDKNFDAAIQQTFADTWEKVQNDLDHWSPTLAADDGDKVTFPSGTKVPVAALPQYKLALEHYNQLGVKVDVAKSQGTTTNKSDFTVFSPSPVKNEAQVFTGPDGEKYTELHSGSWLHTKDAMVEEVAEVPEEILDGAEGWEHEAGPKVEAQQGPVYMLKKAGDYVGKLTGQGEKTITNDYGSNGHPGQHYEITLPTGEVIWYRNQSSTNTALSAQGRVTFNLAGPDMEASLARVKAQLELMGLDMTGAEEADMETLFWRANFNRVLLSKGGNAKIAAARAKLKGMVSELKGKIGDHAVGMDEFSIVEGIGLTMDLDEERKFWHDLAVETWGTETVNKALNSDKYLPQHQHLDLTDPTKKTGMVYFNRVDLDVKDLMAKNTMIAIGNNGKDKSLINYIDTGGMMSTEERLRAFGWFKQGASSGSDQNVGGANGVFTRVANGSAEFSGSIYGQHVAYWSPAALMQTGTYSYSGDKFGELSYLTSSNDYDAVKNLGLSGSSNETLVANTLSIWDYLEIMVFNEETKRQEAIKKMKELGITALRGIPIEERLILRNQLNATMAKVKAQWQKQNTP